MPIHIDFSRVAVLIPCLNEEATIALVVEDFKRALPEATIYVFDNNSTDQSGRLAREAGAQVVVSPDRGKGNVIRHMFASIEADAFVIVDGDRTYPADSAPKMVEALFKDKLDMVVGARIAMSDPAGLSLFRSLGNRAITALIKILFDMTATDVLSGFRVLSKDFVRGISIRSTGFEVEAELAIACKRKGLKGSEIPIDYFPRPEKSVSKLNVFTDGFRIIRSIAIAWKNE